MGWVGVGEVEVGWVGAGDYIPLRQFFFGERRKKIAGEKITVIAEFFGATKSRQKISATSRASGVRAQARQFKNRLSAEVADIFISLARNKNSAMTVIVSRPLERRDEE